MPNFIEISKTPWRKTQIFLHPSVFWLPRGTPLAKCHRSEWWGTSTPSSYTCKISSRSNDPSPRYLLPNFVDFVDGVTHQKTQKHTVNDMSPHYTRGDNKLLLLLSYAKASALTSTHPLTVMRWSVQYRTFVIFVFLCDSRHVTPLT